MLERLRVRNFKLLRDAELEFHHDVPTVLIGPNASGKSTVIEVLDFLARCAAEGLEAAVVAHGGMSAIRTVGVTESVGPVARELLRIQDECWSGMKEARVNGLFLRAMATEREPPTYQVVVLVDGTRVVTLPYEGPETIARAVVIARARRLSSPAWQTQTAPRSRRP
jgi:predicted ATPase